MGRGGMMPMKRKAGGLWFLAAALATGLLAAVLAVRAVAERERQVQVYVTVQDVQPFAALTPELFRREPVPARLAPADAVRDLAEIDQRYARTLLLEGTVLRAGHLATADSPGAVTAHLTETGTPASRALALEVNLETGVGGTLQAGDRVDVIVAVSLNTETGSLPVAKIVARAARVLYAQPPSDTGRQGTVVLEVTPDLAEEIAFAQMAGKVYLAANPFHTDPEAALTEGMTPERFLEKYGLLVTVAGT